METEKLRIISDLVKFVSGSVVVSLITFWVNSGFKDREIALKEQEYLAQFKDDALHDDIEVRRRLAEYFSKVTLSQEARDRWNDYLNLLTQKQSEQKANLDKIAELEKRLNENSLNKDEALEIKSKLNIATAQVEKLDIQLSPIVKHNQPEIGAEGWILSQFLECENKSTKIDLICQTYSARTNLRKTPSIASSGIGALAKNTKVKVLKVEELGWVKVQVIEK